MALQHLHLYHINDLHSHFENWPKIVHYIKRQRRWHALQEEPALVLDIGDHADRCESLTEGTMGKANVALLNDLQIDAATIGNNEGITLAKEDLDHLYDEATFPILLANLFDQNGQRPDWVEPFRHYTLENGLTVGIIGVTVPFYAFYKELGWHIEDPMTRLPDLVHHVQEKADIVILMSHLGYSYDRHIAQSVDGIDVIIGGHTHHLLQHGDRLNNTLIAQAGKFGVYAGRVDLIYDTERQAVVKSEASTVRLSQTEDDLETVHRLQALRDEGEERLQQVVGTLSSPLEAAWYQSSSFAKFLTKSLREWCQADIAMTNAGLLLSSLNQGDVTAADLHRAVPHPINPATITLTGQQVAEIVRQSLTERMIHLEVKGFGFRGKVMGRMVFDGLEVKTERMSDGLEHVRAITIDHQPLDYDAHYRVATTDMLTFGKLYPEIAQAEDKTYYLPEMLRDVLAWKIKKNNQDERPPV